MTNEPEWIKRFDYEFDCVMWWGCHNEDGTQKHGYETGCDEELKEFIKKEKEKSYREGWNGAKGKMEEDLSTAIKWLP